jgi:hypothetical protein
MALTPEKPIKSVTINYVDPAVGQPERLQIFNDPSGGPGQIQFAGGGGRFSSSPNLVWNQQTRTLSILGNIRITDNIIGRYNTNPTNFKLAGGVNGQVLTTDGTGNVSWANLSGVSYGNSNVAAYLPTYAGNVGAAALSFSDGTVQTTAYTGTSGNVNYADSAGTVTANAQPNITSVGALTALTVTGNVAADKFIGDGGLLTNLVPTYGNSNVANYLPNYTGALSGSTANLTGTVILSNIASATSLTSGALRVAGGMGVQGNVYAGEVHVSNIIYSGSFADQADILNSTTNPVFIGFKGGQNYVQGVVKNSLGTGSADWTAFNDIGDDTNGWISQGIAGSTFNDANYTITGPGDGYLFNKGLVGFGGNLVLATGQTGGCNDIVFATGGFLTTNEFGRIQCQNNTFKLTRANASVTFTDNTVQNTAWTGSVAASNVTGLGNIVATNLDGNASNILYGNGVFAAAPASTYGDSNVTILLASYGSNTISTTGNISVGAVTASGKIGYSAGGNVTQSSSGQSVTVNQLTGKVTLAKNSWTVGDLEVFNISCNKVSTDDLVMVQAVDTVDAASFNAVAYPNPILANTIQVQVKALESVSASVVLKFFILQSPLA